MTLYNQIFDVAMHAAKSSAQIILKALSKPKDIKYKGKYDLVTKTDHESELNIKSIIYKNFPDHKILSEETESTESDSPYLWVVDPLDGTTNFVHNYPFFAVSIGVFYENKPIVGVVVELPENNLYYAIINEGAFCNNIAIKVSKTSLISSSLMVTGFGYNHGDLWKINMHLFKHFTDITQGVRRLGAASVDLCHTACGKVDGFWEFDLQPWDTAAGLLIVTEAGGKISKLDGKPFSIFNNQILASNSKLHSKIVNEIERSTLEFNS